MRKNMKKLTVATVIGAMTVTALAPVSAQAKDKTLTVAIWDNGQKAGLQEIMDEFTKETGIKTELQVVEENDIPVFMENLISTTLVKVRKNHYDYIGGYRGIIKGQVVLNYH